MPSANWGPAESVHPAQVPQETVDMYRMAQKGKLTGTSRTPPTALRFQARADHRLYPAVRGDPSPRGKESSFEKSTSFSGAPGTSQNGCMRMSLLWAHATARPRRLAL
jgi:hypothetical protein